MEDLTVIKHNLKIFKTEEEYFKKLTQISDDPNIDFILDNPHVVLIEDENERKKVRYYELKKELREYFTIEALDNEIHVKFPQHKLQYYTEKGWQELGTGQDDSLTIRLGEKIRFKMSYPQLKENSGIGTFIVDGNFNVEGNIMSLYYGENFLNATSLENPYIFSKLFENCKTLQSAKYLVLPADILSQNCYEYMFRHCHSLKEPPRLPATVLASYCYREMFYECLNLKNAPVLPATKLSSNCYERMFENCKLLNKAPELPATKLSPNCYNRMFGECVNLTEIPDLPAITLEKECYYEMFYNCSSLTRTGNINAMVLASYCCEGMFARCHKLENVSTLNAETLANGCYRYMFSECSSLKSAPAIKAKTLASNSCLYMFYKCSNLTTPPELPATSLANGCYSNMFDSCTKLNLFNYILPATILKRDCYYEMFKNCASLINPPEIKAIVLDSNCFSNMFCGCVNLKRAPELLATTLSTACYNRMFWQCIKLEEAPELLAKTLVHSCYAGMFYGCNNLKKIKMLATGEIDKSCLDGWAEGVSGDLKFIKNVCILKEKFPENSIGEGWDIDEYCKNVPSFINLSSNEVTFYKGEEDKISSPEEFSDRANCCGFVGELKNIIGNFDDKCVSIKKITSYARKELFNSNMSVWCVLFFKNENNEWEVVYRSTSSKKMEGLEENDEFSFDMECINETRKVIKSTDIIAIAYTSDPNEPINSQVQLGLRAVGSTESDETKRPGALIQKLTNKDIGNDWWRPEFCIEYTPYSKVYTPNADNGKPKYSNGGTIYLADLRNILPINDININVVYAVNNDNNEIIGNTIKENYKWSSLKTFSGLIEDLSKSSSEYGDIEERIIIIIKDDNNIDLT
jgi:hypothetical protein